ncbi:unnamed protein product [Ilex paraguariensis]|uniref:Membrane-associated kinase regulator 4 n=1 Tax=Ilex paraguariensis TaxID=185542 RepID=A0ABC8U468_9AQUA
MAESILSYDHEDEDYIDIELSSHSNLFCHSKSSPPHPLEFEFQMFSSSSERDTTTSPADELFYKGQLLPLHLPPRLQMVEKLLHHSNSYHNKSDITIDEFFSTPLTTNTNTTPIANTPFESCNISPSDSCQVSRELSPDEYFLEYSTVSNNFIGENPKKSWTEKLKLIKQSSIGSKLKASRTYLKSLFSKSGCSDESTAATPRKFDDESFPKAKDCVNKYARVPKMKTPFGQIQRERNQMSMRSFNKEKIAEDGHGHHRRSFSVALKRFSMTKSSSFSLSSSGSSSSSLSDSKRLHELQIINRSCSTNEDYIDIELSSHSNLFCHSKSSPPHPLEFEFQMFSSSSERDTTTSPADELFYKGQLLPLHLPPRLQMVEKLLHHSNSYHNKSDITIDEFFSTPLTTNTNTTPIANTPFESCNISPSDSCQVSRELSPDEYFLEYSTVSNNFIGENPKKSWTEKLKLIKQSSIGSKLKASRTYLKSLFSKSGCSDESTAATPRKFDDESFPKAKDCVNKYARVPKMKTPFGQIQRERNQMSMRSFNKEKIAEDGHGHHRRSFSVALKRFSTTKSSSFSLSSSGSSSSSLSDSKRLHELQIINRSCSTSMSEFENSIQAAIAHCKRAQQQFCSRKTANEIGYCSLSASRIVCEDQARPGLCRG